MDEEKKKQLVATILANQAKMVGDSKNQGVASFEKLALPMIRAAYPTLTANGCGIKNFKGHTNIDDVDFMALIPDQSVTEYEKWYNKKFEEQNIDSSIRGEIISILDEAGVLPCHMSVVWSDGLVGVQPMAGPTSTVYNMRYKYVNEDDSED